MPISKNAPKLLKNGPKLPKPVLRKGWTQNGRYCAGFWQVRIEKKYVPLEDADGNRLSEDADLAAATQAVSELLHKQAAAAKRGADPLVEDILNDYLEDFKRRVEKGTAGQDAYRDAETYCFDFVHGWTISRKDGKVGRCTKIHDGFGKLHLSELKKHHVHTWLNKHPNWKSYNFKRRNVGVLQAALNHAVAYDKIAYNPLKEFPLDGTATPRKLYMLPSEIKLVREYATRKNPAFLKLQNAMLATGCRPSELCKVKASHLFTNELGEHYWMLSSKEHKTGTKTERDRLIPLTPELHAMTLAAIAAGDKGFLFLTKFGTRWTKESWRQVWARVRKNVYKANMSTMRPEFLQVVFYDFRGTTITSCIDSGASKQAVADATGTSVNMIDETYYKDTPKRQQNASNALRMANL